MLLLSIFGFNWFTFLLIGAIAVYAFIKYYGKTETFSHAHHSFDNFHFDSNEFYELVKEEIANREIKGVTYENIIHPETSLLGNTRRYLRIHVENFRFDVCAAHFARGSYVSWYFAVHTSPIKGFLSRWQYMQEQLEKKTYYQWDTETILKSFMQDALSSAVERLVANKAQRIPSERVLPTIDTATSAN